LIRAVALSMLLCGAALAEKQLLRVGRGEGPFPGACVKALAREAELLFDLDAFVPDALTDERGEAVVEGERFLVYAPGFALAIATPRPGPVDVELRPERRLSSRVVDAQGNGIFRAEVTARTTFRQKAAFRVRTREDGTFHLVGLWLDDLSFSAEAPGFLDGREIGVIAGAEVPPLALARPALIEGKVIDGESRPLAAVTVAWGAQRAVTGGEGEFRLTQLAPGSAAIEVAAPYGTVPLTIALADGERRTGILVHAERPAVVTLRVVDERRAAIPGAKVWDAGADATGLFRLRVRPGEPARLAIFADGFAPAVVWCDAPRPGSSTDLGEIALARWKRDTVRVLLPDGSPALTGTVRGAPILAGIAEIEMNGKYGYVTVAVPGYPTLDAWVDGGHETLVEVPEPYWLEGIALGTDGEAVVGAKVSAGRPPQGVTCVTDAKGRFRVGPLVRQRQPISVSHPGYLPYQLELPLKDGPLETRLERAPPARQVAGRVRRGGEPVTDFILFGRRILDEGGRFEVALEGRATDAIVIDVSGRSYVFALPPEGEVLVADLPGGALRVELEGSAGGDRVELRSLAGHLSATAVATAEGSATLEALPLGQVRVEAAGYRGETVAVREGGIQTVRLPRVGLTTVLLRSPWGEGARECDPRDTRADFEMESDLAVVLEGLRLTPGEELVVDLRTSRPGGLTVVGGGGAVEIRSASAHCEFKLEAFADERGFARFHGLPAGSYTIRSGILHKTVRLSPGELLEIDVSQGPHALRGTIRFRDGRACAGAQVEATCGGVARSVTCDQQGRYSIDGLRPGAYALVASLRACAPARVEVVIGQQGLLPGAALDLVLDPLSGAALTVVDPTGAPVRNLPLRVDRIRSDTDLLGRCPLPRLPAVVDVELDGFVSVRGQRIEADGATIRLERAGGLCVWLRGGQPTPTLFCRGRDWPLRRVGDRASAFDLPPGPALLRWGGEAPPDPLTIVLVEGEETLFRQD